MHINNKATLSLLTLLSFVASMSLVACAQPASIDKEHQQPLTSLKLLIENKSCDQNSQCKALPIGHRACGGPESYEVYSTQNTNSEKVEQLAKQYQEQRRQENKDKGVVSICQFLPEPQTACRAQQCVLLEKQLNSH